MKRNRLVIYPTDIQLVTGRGLRYSQRIMRVMKKRLGKKKHQHITIDEFCEFSGIDRKNVEKCL